MKGPPLKRGRLRWAGLALLAAVPLGLAAVVLWQHAIPGRPPAERARLVALARRTYGRRCAPCHGPHMEGRTLSGGVEVPPLAKPGFRIFFRLLPAAMEDWVQEQIAEGNAVMPHFGDLLDADSLDALAYYLRLVNTGELQPD